MIKLKSLNKKLRRLEASLQKDAKKLAKLRRKVEAALSAESAQAKVISVARVAETSRPAKPVKPVKPAKPAKPAAPRARKKRALTPEGREKLSALMKARWAAKKAGAAPASEPRGTEG